MNKKANHDPGYSSTLESTRISNLAQQQLANPRVYGEIVKYIRFKDAESFSLCCKMLYQIIEEIRNSWNSIRVPLHSVRKIHGFLSEWELPGGFPHNWRGPARSYQDRTSRSEYYYVDGLRHRLGGPAVIREGVRNSKEDKYAWHCNKFLEFGEYSTRKWYVHGVLHRKSEPARIHRYTDLGYTYEIRCWYKSGKLHRENGPAIVEALVSEERVGQITEQEVWCKNGLIHRENGPAWIYTSRWPGLEGVCAESEWFVDGKFKSRIFRTTKGSETDETYKGSKNSFLNILWDILKDAIKTKKV